MGRSFEKAESFRDSINSDLSGKDLRSFAKIVPMASEDGTYEIRIVLHPDEEDVQSSYEDLSFVPWTGEPEGDQYVERTPRTPSRRDAPYDDWYPSDAKRRVEPSTHYPDVNPNYPGLRRVPDLQDLVRKVAMRQDLKDRIVKVDRVLQLSKRLSRFAYSNRGKGKEPGYLMGELLDVLKADGHTGRHKCVRLVKKLKTSLKSDGYVFEEE